MSARPSAPLRETLNATGGAPSKKRTRASAGDADKGKAKAKMPRLSAPADLSSGPIEEESPFWPPPPRPRRGERRSLSQKWADKKFSEEVVPSSSPAYSDAPTTSSSPTSPDKHDPNAYENEHSKRAPEPEPEPDLSDYDEPYPYEEEDPNGEGESSPAHPVTDDALAPPPAPGQLRALDAFSATTRLIHIAAFKSIGNMRAPEEADELVRAVEDHIRWLEEYGVALRERRAELVEEQEEEM